MADALDDLAAMGGYIAGAVAANEYLLCGERQRTVEAAIISELRNWLQETEEGKKIAAMSLHDFARYCGQSCDENDPHNSYVWWGRHGR